MLIADRPNWPNCRQPQETEPFMGSHIRSRSHKIPSLLLLIADKASWRNYRQVDDGNNNRLQEQVGLPEPESTKSQQTTRLSIIGIQNNHHQERKRPIVSLKHPEEPGIQTDTSFPQVFQIHAWWKHDKLWKNQADRYTPHKQSKLMKRLSTLPRHTSDEQIARFA